MVSMSGFVPFLRKWTFVVGEEMTRLKGPHVIQIYVLLLGSRQKVRITNWTNNGYIEPREEEQ